MRILLISLPGGHGTDEPIFPLGIGYLVAVLKKEHQVKVAHYQKFEHVGSTLPELINSFRPEVVGFTCTTFNRGNVRNIVSIIKKYCPNIKVVVGGVHASFLYEQVLNSYGADVVVIGEGEYTALELCRALENGTSLDDINGIAFKRAGSVILTPPRQPIENLDELPMPDYDFAEHLMRISGMGFVITSRGCPVRCIFCSTSSYWGQKVRKTSVTRVVDEMEYLIDRYKVRKIFFHDDTFNLGIERVKQICSEIMRRNVNIEWAASCRVTPASQEMVDIMAEAGCRHICWGVETGSETMLKSLEKKITLEQIRNAYELTKNRHQIMSSGAFAMVGNHGETDQTIRETVDFFNTIPLTDHPSTAILCLLPGTKIYFDMKSKGLVDDSVWLLTDEVPRTNEHSEATLHQWAQQVSGSGNILPFDKKRHFWNNALFGDIPKPQIPRFFIDQSESQCKAAYNTNSINQNSPAEKPLPHSYRSEEQGLPATGEFKRQSERCIQLSPSSGVAGSLSASELDNIIPPEIKDDEFYRTILKLSREEDIRTVLEIGSSAGDGSTEAFVSGLRENKNKPTLFCIEVSKSRFSNLQKRYEADSFVKCYHASSIPVDKFLSEDEVVKFYDTIRTTLANYPVDRVLGWLRQDIEYVESSGAPDNGIQIIKKDNGISNFDLVLIDGSAFTGGAELDEVYGAKIILLDDINDIKNYNNYRRLSDDPNYSIVTQNWKLRNGYAVFKRNDLIVPIHFFTIVLNGEPFIRYHIDVFKKLPFKWHWHIIEGVADLKHDTAWSVEQGGRISSELHRNGLSNDGTTEYLDELARQYPENITIYRKSDGVFWDGKLEMVNAPLVNIKQECLLWQVDSDELWTLEQIKTVKDMFIDEPDRTAAYYLDHFFVGEDFVTTTIDTYGNNTSYEWLRTWRFKPGYRWTAHEPPRLCMPAGNGEWADIAAIKPFKHSQTSDKGLVFQHYAYATEKQLGFKEIYYGYENAIAQWRRLQRQQDFPVFLRDYFAWVKDAAQVNTVKSQHITPIAWTDDNDRWHFGSRHSSLSNCRKVLIVRPDVIGDFVIFSIILPSFRTLHPEAKISILLQDSVAQLAQDCPYIDEIITFKESRIRDAQYRGEILTQLQSRHFDIAYHPVYSRSEIGDLLTLQSGAAKKVAFDGDCSNLSAQLKYNNDKNYDILVPSTPGVLLETNRNREFVRGLGVDVPDSQGTCIWLNQNDEDHVIGLLKGLSVNNPIMVSPFARFGIKDWPIEKWAQLLSHYPDESILLCGGPEDYEKAQKLIALSSHGHIYNLCGKTTLSQTAALMGHCKLYIGVDTGPAHMAIAANIPNVVLMGGGHFGRFMPYSASTTMVHCKVSCANCNWRCRFRTKPAPCLTQISVKTVIKAITAAGQQAVSERKEPLVITETIPYESVQYRIEEVEPVRNMYQHGLQLLQSNDRTSAKSLLEEAVIRLKPYMTMGVQWETPGEGEHYYDTVRCYINACKTLAQCYMQAGEFGKIKAVYQHLLENPVLVFSDEQISAFCTVIAKLQKVESNNSIFAATAARASQIVESPVFKPSETDPKYLVSAIISTYNSEKFIRGCLEDLESQTIADKLEIIVVNSGSEQNEESIVKEFQKKYGNIVYIKTEREGLYIAWNRAVKVASGQFLTSANTDDRHRRDAFEAMANTLLKNTDVALVYGDQIVTDTPNPTFENHHVIELAKRPEFSKERLLFGCCVGSQPMWRKSLHDEFGGFDETLTCASDWDFWLKVAGKYSFKHIPESLGLYYRNEQGIEHGRKIHSLYERYAVGRRYGNPYISVIQHYQARGNPLVSIVMAAYNAAGYIARAIESVLIQNYRNFELIVVDDGSTDRTAEIVRSFKNEPIRYFHKENGGASSARNYALKKVGGSFVVILDSDDMITLDFIARHLQVFEQNPETDLVYCDDCFIDDNDKPIRVMRRPEYSDQKTLISDMFRCAYPVVPFRTCIRKSVFDKIGLYDERLRVSEDYDMMRRFVSQGLKACHLPAALYLRRPTTGSLSRSFNTAKAKSLFEVIRRLTETFTPEQLFPNVHWENLPVEQKQLLAKCKTALAYLGHGELYLGTNAPDFAEVAFEMACATMDDCCKIEPGNQQVRGMREKCLEIRAKHSSSGSRGVYQTV